MCVCVCGRSTTSRAEPPAAAIHLPFELQASLSTGPSKPTQSRGYVRVHATAAVVLAQCAVSEPGSASEPRAKIRMRLSRQPTARKRPSGEAVTARVAVAPIASGGVGADVGMGVDVRGDVDVDVGVGECAQAVSSSQRVPP